MGFGLDAKANPFDEDRDAPIKCLDCSRPVRAGWRCLRCSLDDEAQREA
jgi:hypothetical protein